MAEIWCAYEGSEPTRRGPQRVLPMKTCAELGLWPAEYLHDLTGHGPRFGDSNDTDGWIRGYQHVVLKVDAEEAKAEGCKPGYYLTRVSPKQAHESMMRMNLDKRKDGRDENP